MRNTQRVDPIPEVHANDKAHLQNSSVQSETVIVYNNLEQGASYFVQVAGSSASGNLNLTFTIPTIGAISVLLV